MPHALPTFAAMLFALATPALAAQSLTAPPSAPAAPAPVVWSSGALVMQPVERMPPAALTNTSAPALALPAARPAALVARTTSEPAKAPRLPQSSNRTNTALMLVGLATILVGTAVDDDAGTVLILSGAGIGLYGLYRWLQ